MPFSPDQVRDVVRQGLSAVCATCDRFWQAQERGVPNLRCTSSSCNGGPIAGGEFSDYKGPMSEFDRWCLVCGGDSTHGITAAGRRRRFGVCDAHLHMLAALRPIDRQAETPIIEIKSLGGALIKVERLLHRKKGLFDAIAEAEEYFQEQDAKRGN